MGNQLTDNDLETSLGKIKSSNSLNEYMTKINFCYSENDELIQIHTNDSIASEILLRKRIFKINSNLLKNSKTLEFKIKDPEIEKKFNIGIFQFEDYLAFYINFTAYNEHINSRESTD